jgi:hypothetical protein
MPPSGALKGDFPAPPKSWRGKNVSAARTVKCRFLACRSPRLRRKGSCGVGGGCFGPGAKRGESRRDTAKSGPPRSVDGCLSGPTIVRYWVFDAHSQTKMQAAKGKLGRREGRSEAFSAACLCCLVAEMMHIPRCETQYFCGF